MLRLDHSPAIPPNTEINYFPATRERRSSFIEITVSKEVAVKLGHAEQRTTEDQPEVKILLKDSGKLLGKGSESSVRLFDTGTPHGPRVAVASPCSTMTLDSLLVRDAKSKQRMTNQVYGKNFVQGFFYPKTYRLVMPVFNGITLQQAMEKNPSVVKKCFVTLIQAIAKALQWTHDQGVIHGDFKEDNIFLGNDPETSQTIAWLIDFGFAQQVGKKVEKFANIVYWPPEKITKLEEILLAETSQDIFGLAYMIQRLLKSFKIESDKTIFHDWCKAAQQDDPSLRPCLQPLIDATADYLAQEKSLYSLKGSLKELVKNIAHEISLAPLESITIFHFRLLFFKSLDQYFSQMSIGLKDLACDKKSIQAQTLYLIGKNISKLTPNLKKFIEVRNKNQLCTFIDNDLDRLLGPAPDELQPTPKHKA
ncbi:MAG: protein kinase [Gammaproteobacteria bacterium]|jgi:serine/threonine protein kinase|nr:protein kinase [Gammaproteobacteria bacterium]